MLAQNGTQDVPACLSCHGWDNRNPLVPSLDGQGREYLKQQLVLWRAEKRGGGERAALMHSAAEQQIAQIATFFAARAPQSHQGSGPTDFATFAWSWWSVSCAGV